MSILHQILPQGADRIEVREAAALAYFAGETKGRCPVLGSQRKGEPVAEARGSERRAKSKMRIEDSRFQISDFKSQISELRVEDQSRFGIIQFKFESVTN